MSIKTQKIISAAINALAAFGGFAVLVKILNLNQVGAYVSTAFYVWLFFALQTIFLYDLHLKNPRAWTRSKSAASGLGPWIAALQERMAHFKDWGFFIKWLNYLLLPGIIFWSTISVFFTNFGFIKIQVFFALLSGAALVLNYWYIKEVFSRNKEKADQDVFVGLSMVKIYASALMYGASLSLIRHYCLDPGYFFWGAFALAFLLIYQALYQHRLVNLKNLLITLGISGLMSALAYWTAIFWGYNYISAAIFLGVFYNFFWGVFHYHLDKSLTRRAFAEILIVSVAIAAMALGTTNFKAKIFDSCQYQQPRF